MIENFLFQYPNKTQVVYRQVLLEAESTVGKPLKYFTHNDVVDYQRAIEGQAPATVVRKLATLSSYFKYLADIGIIPASPMRGVRRPKVDRNRPVRWLTDEEAEDVLAIARRSPRDLALVWVALHGLRLSEITNLNVEQYADGMLWNIVGKGNKTRTIPLGHDAQLAVERYIGNRRSGPLFTVKHHRISVRGVQELVYRLTELTGERVNVHALRHTFGTRAIRKGVNPIALARLMGHNSTETTNRYVHLNPDDLKESTEKIYPANKSPSIITVIDGGRKENLG